MEYTDFSKITISNRLDASWQLCPVPILMAQEKIAGMAHGAVLEVIFTDPGARPDLEAWCRINGHELIAFQNGKTKNSAYIKKKKI